VNIILVYHGGVTRQTRRLYADVASQPAITDLTVVVPERVQSERVYAPSGWLTAEPEETADGYSVVPIPLNDPTNYSRGFDRSKLRSALRTTNADVIHVLDEPFSGYLLQVIQVATAYARRSRILFYGFENRPLSFGRRAGVIWKFAWPRTAGGAAANSEALDNLRRAGYPSGRPLERIFWGIPTDVFANAPRRSLGIDAERVVGYVGRLVPDKGLYILAAAMLHLPSEVHCVLIGSGPLRPELELFASLPRLQGRLHFRDVMASGELAGALAGLDVLALPSVTMPRWKEQYGRVLAESMAAGVPVVGSDSGAIPEVVGDAGLIAPEGDPTALAAALNVALFDDARRMQLIELGRHRAETELSTSVMARRLASLYERVLSS